MCVIVLLELSASPSWNVPPGVSTVIGNVIVLPALVNTIVPRPEKVWVKVPDTVTPELKVTDP